jgi:hypothetical protein
MKKHFASLLALLGAARPAPRTPKVQSLDPRSIRFSMPTISIDLAELEKLSSQPSTTELILHEDEWCQIEFFPKSRLAEIQRVLSEYKPFEIAHREQYGWREIYVRRIERVAVIGGPEPLAQLESSLNIKAEPAPIFRTFNTILGRVRNGLTIPLGGNVHLYGYISGGTMPVLAAHVGKDPDDTKLTEAFTKLSADQGLILVDWRAQLILISVTNDGQIEVWRP